MTPKFALGQVVATPGALEALERAGQIPMEFISRHAQADWGECDQEDWALNDQALCDGSRLFSAYKTRLDERIWLITEADRSVSTLLTPGEY